MTSREPGVAPPALALFVSPKPRHAMLVPTTSLAG